MGERRLRASCECVVTVAVRRLAGGVPTGPYVQRSSLLTMTGPPDSAVEFAATHAHVEGYLAEDDVLLAARAEGNRWGCTPVGPGAGAGLRFLAAAIAARAVVEVGTGTG